MPDSKRCTTVFYDGSCPLCTIEINQYRSIAPQYNIAWVDVTTPDFVPPVGHTQQVLMQRFHVQAPNGDLISGAAAFVYIWALLPVWKYLALMARMPGMLGLMEFAYVSFLKFRPLMQRLMLKK
jgi:ubiquinone biosynthesis monooxygenase Coq7